MSDPIEQAGRVIWETSRRDEGTISATGGKHVAQALADAGLLPTEVEYGRQHPEHPEIVWDVPRGERHQEMPLVRRYVTEWREVSGNDG